MFLSELWPEKCITEFPLKNIQFTQCCVGGRRTEYLCKNCVVTLTDQAVTAQVM